MPSENTTRVTMALPAMAVIFALLPLPAAAQNVTHNGEDCGPLRIMNKYGPFDYRTAPPSQRQLVENIHFTFKTEMLIEPAVIKPDGYAADYAYTLFAFPNHPRALAAMARLAVRDKTTKPKYASWSVDCYFARGMTLTPNDNTVPLLYADYLRQVGKKGEAAKYLSAVSERVTDNPLTLYNIGLQYMAINEPEKAREFADRAKQLGHPNSKLDEELKRIGK